MLAVLKQQEILPPELDLVDFIFRERGCIMCALLSFCADHSLLAGKNNMSHVLVSAFRVQNGDYFSVQSGKKTTVSGILGI